MDPDSFWTQTPRTFVAIMEGRNEAARVAHNDRMSLAWHIAALPGMWKFPRLNDLILEAQPSPRRAQTPEQMLLVMKEWVAATKRAADA